MRRPGLLLPLLTAGLALGGCSSHGLGAVGPFSFSLDALHPAAATPAPVAVAGSPAPAPSAEAAPERVPPPGGSGGASSARLAGTVTDRAGRAIAGATITGAAEPATAGADGRFSATGGPLLTASRPGYVSQTLEAPYAFALAPLTPGAGPAYDITGTTVPALPGALVVFADADGVEVRAVADAAGAFALHVTPRSTPPAPGLVVASTGLVLPGDDRYHVLQAATPRAGALAVDPAHPTGLAVAVAPAPGRLALQAPTLPAGLATGATELSIESAAGARAVLSWASGPWPADMPAPSLPGMRTCVAVSARSVDGTAFAVSEHVVAATEARWAPVLPAPPADVAVSPDGHVSWQGDAARYALAAYAPGAARPAWEGVTRARALTLPALTGLATLEVQASDTDEVLLPTRPIALTADRRFAGRRVSLGVSG